MVSGLGIWFCYTSDLSLVACTITWLIVERLPRPSELGWVVAGSLIGLLAWLAYNVGRDYVGPTRVFEMFSYGDPIEGIRRIRPFATSDKL